MADLKRKNCANIFICLAFLGGFIAILVYMTGEDELEEDLNDPNNTLTNSTDNWAVESSDYNSTNKLIDQLQSDLSGHFTILIVIGFTLAGTIAI